MTDYTLTIDIDPGGVAILNETQENVVILKENPGPTGSYTAWVTNLPATTITVTWQDDYEVYSSTTNVQNGAVVVADNPQEAEGGYLYTFSGSTFDGGTSGTLLPTQYGVNNQDQQYKINGISQITTGLLQSATVNGTSLGNPLNAVLLPYNQQAIFTPIEKIYVFPAAMMQNAAVITEITGNACVVDLTESSTQAIHYDDNKNQFVPGKLAATAGRR